MPPGWCPLDPAADRPADDRLGRDPRPSALAPTARGTSSWSRKATSGSESRPPPDARDDRDRDPDLGPDADPQSPARPTPRSARSTTSRGRSTTPSWTRSSSSGPPATAKYPKVGEWVKAEGDRAIEHWRRHFRGEARVKDDSTHHRRRHRLLEPGPLGRPREQRRPQADRRQAADPLGRRQGRRRPEVVPGRDPRADPDLPEPAQPVEIRRAQQRVHVPRI